MTTARPSAPRISAKPARTGLELRIAPADAELLRKALDLTAAALKDPNAAYDAVDQRSLLCTRMTMSDPLCALVGALAIAVAERAGLDPSQARTLSFQLPIGAEALWDGPICSGVVSLTKNGGADETIAMLLDAARAKLAPSR